MDEVSKALPTLEEKPKEEQEQEKESVKEDTKHHADDELLPAEEVCSDSLRGFRSKPTPPDIWPGFAY